MPRPNQTRASLEAAIRLYRANGWRGRLKDAEAKLEALNSRRD